MVASRAIASTDVEPCILEWLNAKNPIYGCKGDGTTDDTTGLNAVIAAGASVNGTVSIPLGVYANTGLTISGNVTIRGANVCENWNNGINVPLGTPPLLGTVLFPASNGSNAITISGTSLCVHLEDFGILFQTPFSGTGDGIHYVPAQNTQGLSGSTWKNIKVWGHDGNHYAYNLTNPIYCTFISCFAYGGGGYKLYGSSTAGQYGNCLFLEPYVQTICGGTGNCYDVRCDSGAHYLNLCTFIRPQGITDNIPGTSPSGNGPTSAQWVWFEDTNVGCIRKIGCDFESNVSSGITLNPGQGFNNDFDFAGMNLGNLLGGINAPAWTTQGLFYGPVTRAVTDITSSGTVARQSHWVMPAITMNAASAATYTRLNTLELGIPNAGTNVTAPTRNSLYAAGQIETAGALTAAAGMFITGGTVSLNNNSNFNTQICSGTSTGTIGLGTAPVTTAKVAVAAATTGHSSINIASGAAPTSPVNGDIWFDGTNIKMQIGGATKTFTLT